MPAQWKPDGHSSVSPYLLVDDAQRLIDFLREVFGAVQVRRFDDPAGGVLHAEVRIDDSIVMIADAAPAWPAVTCMVHVYVADVDSTYRRALSAGARSVQEPAKKEGDPDRRGGFLDAIGNTWWVATQQDA